MLGGMTFFAMIFTLLFFAAALVATLLVGMLGGGYWGALAFALALALIWRGLNRPATPPRSMHRNTLNAFQRPLADDD